MILVWHAKIAHGSVVMKFDLSTVGRGFAPFALASQGLRHRAGRNQPWQVRVYGVGQCNLEI